MDGAFPIFCCLFLMITWLLFDEVFEIIIMLLAVLVMQLLQSGSFLSSIVRFVRGREIHPALSCFN